MTVDPAALPRPLFIDHDPAAVTARLVASFESIVGRTLQPAQPERLFIDWMAYQLALQRIAVQDAGEQTLLAYARGAALDHLGALLGVARLPAETDERLRGRINEAPETFSVAGPAMAYRALTFSVDPSIIDVAVTRPVAGAVRVTVLTGAGMPGDALRAAVLARLSGEKARPLGDAVEVVAPVRVPFTLSATITLSAGVDRPTVTAAVSAAAVAWVAERRAGLGRDLVPSQAIAALQTVPGVHKVDLVSPALAVLDGDQWADGAVGALAIAVEGADG